MRGLYLIAPAAAAELRAARAQAVAAESLVAFGARSRVGSNGAPDLLSVVDGVAQISITGILTEQPDFFSFYFGGGNTVYSDIRTSLRLAESDPAVREVLLSIASPGGTVEGLFETLQVLEAFSKPIKTRASAALSAAFGIAAAAGGPIEAVTDASPFGSIGVATSLFIDDSVVDITNRGSEAKRPDPSTPEGREVVQTELDSIYEVFAGAIARGRGTTLAKVRSDFGKGATLLAGQAREAGMVDGIAPSPTKPNTSARAAATSDGLATLLAARLEGETSEQYVARCSRLLDAMGRPAPAAKPAPTRQDLAGAVAAQLDTMPSPFPSGEPAGTAALIEAMSAMPPAFPRAPAPAGEADSTPGALAAAVERLSNLEWPNPAPAAARLAAPPAAPGAELAAAIEAELALGVAS